MLSYATFVTLALSHSKVDFTEDKICVTCSYRKGESQPGRAFYVRCKTVGYLCVTMAKNTFDKHEKK